MFSSKQLTIFAIMIIFLMIERFIPVNFGDPLSAFVAVIGYYIIGFSAISFSYLLLTIRVLVGLPDLWFMSDSIRTAVIAAANYPAEVQANITNVSFVLVFVGTIYFSQIMYLLGARYTIKKFGILKRLKYVH